MEYHGQGHHEMHAGEHEADKDEHAAEVALKIQAVEALLELAKKVPVVERKTSLIDDVVTVTKGKKTDVYERVLADQTQEMEIVETDLTNMVTEDGFEVTNEDGIVHTFIDRYTAILKKETILKEALPAEIAFERAEKGTDFDHAKVIKKHNDLNHEFDLMDYDDLLASENHDLHRDWIVHPQTETRQIAHEVASYNPHMMNLMSIDADTIPSLMEEASEMNFLNLREIDIEPNGKSKVHDHFIPAADFNPVDDLDFTNAIPINQIQDYEWVYYD